ncbi:MAG TPA: DUF6308 family protein [Nitrososphaerales archaeon]|nr:DUF6308 family protein [Nitrososphaerales archaeon]
MKAIALANGAVFERAPERVREYCEVEVYRDRNYRGGYDDHHSITDSVTAEDVEAANNMYARLSALDKGRMTHSSEIQERLGAIKDAELAEVDGPEWKGARAEIALLLSSFMSLPHVSLGQCTRVLHVKRPHLIPILDPLVVKFLTGNDLERNAFSDGEMLQIGLGSLDAVRGDIASNRAAFSDLQAELSDLPVPLTNVRLHGILCWTQEKWVNRGDTAGPYGVAGKSLNQGPPPPPAVGISKDEEEEPQGEIHSIKEFRQVKLKADGVIVTTGSKPPRAHRALCRELSEERFTEAVVFNEGKKGRYYLRGDLAEAVRDFQAVACMKCRPERPIVRRD